MHVAVYLPLIVPELAARTLGFGAPLLRVKTPLFCGGAGAGLLAALWRNERPANQVGEVLGVEKGGRERAARVVAPLQDLEQVGGQPAGLVAALLVMTG